MSSTRHNWWQPVKGPSYGRKAGPGDSDSTHKSREFICKSCEYRFTVGTDGECEYGHKRDCQYWQQGIP